MFLEARSVNNNEYEYVYVNYMSVNRLPGGHVGGGGGEGQRGVQHGQAHEADLLLEDAVREQVADVHGDHDHEDDGHGELDAARGLEQDHRERERHARHAGHLRRRAQQRVLARVHRLRHTRGRGSHTR